MSDFGEIVWQLEQHRQLRGGCSCGDSTILGVIHSDTRPCSLPVVRMPLTDDQIWNMWRLTKGTQLDFARAIEKAHSIGEIYEV